MSSPNFLPSAIFHGVLESSTPEDARVISWLLGQKRRWVRRVAFLEYSRHFAVAIKNNWHSSILLEPTQVKLIAEVGFAEAEDYDISALSRQIVSQFLDSGHGSTPVVLEILQAYFDIEQGALLKKSVTLCKSAQKYDWALFWTRGMFHRSAEYV